MGVDFAGNYACLAIGYLEKVKLFGLHMVPSFTPEEIAMILKAFMRYVDDGFVFWPVDLDMEIFISMLNSLHPSIKYTVERGVIENDSESLNFLDIKVTLHGHRTIETQLYYKETNNHHYLEYNSFHEKHIKDNIPYNFFKKIIVFTSDSVKEKAEIERMKKWLYNSGYPKNVINRGLHNARLQGPAPDPSKKKAIIPFVTQNCSNYSCSSIKKKLSQMIEHCPDDATRKFFQSRKIVEAARQPQNILRQLTSAKFDSNKPILKPPGSHKCKSNHCKICRLYLQEVTSVTGKNGNQWTLLTHITCKSQMVLYYLVCLGCGKSYVGKTNCLRDRTNNHISEGKSGNTTDRFDQHIFQCKTDHQEPLFKLFVLLEVNNYDKLIVYEDYLHKQGFDDFNRKKATATA